MRVLVCGSRDYLNRDELFALLDSVHAEHKIDVIIEGEARGADTLARMWAEQNNVTVEAYPADWKHYGKAAGPIRNKQMLDEGNPDWVYAFPSGRLSESRGTRNMVEQAYRRGFPITTIGINDVTDPGIIHQRRLRDQFTIQELDL